jgi:methyl-accepting chemotaxis protein
VQHLTQKLRPALTAPSLLSSGGAFFFFPVETMDLLGAVLTALVSALTIGAMTSGFMSRYMQRKFDGDVIAALVREAAAYKEFHERVFASELDRGRRAADIASGVQHDLAEHRAEVRRFIDRFDGQQQITITVAQNVVHLDETMKRLDKTIDRMGERFDSIGERVQEVAEAVAELRGGR